MHYQENTLFDLDTKVKGVKVTQNVAQYPQHHVTMDQQSYILLHPKVKEKMHLQDNTLFDRDLRFGSRSYEMLPSALYIM